MAGPAAEVTRDRPWAALVAEEPAWDTVSLVASAAFVAVDDAGVAVDSKRRAAMRRPICRTERRTIGLAAATDGDMAVKIVVGKGGKGDDSIAGAERRG